jgi:6-phosphogluconate dehydrogenase
LARLAALGILYIEAPISGGAAKASRGEMAMMTSGRPEAYAVVGSLRWRPRSIVWSALAPLCLSRPPQG